MRVAFGREPLGDGSARLHEGCGVYELVWGLAVPATIFRQPGGSPRHSRKRGREV